MESIQVRYAPDVFLDMENNKPIVARRELYGMVDGDSWSYLVNDNGNTMRFTLGGHYEFPDNQSCATYMVFTGFGSCTPVEALDAWIAGLSVEENNKYAEMCDNTDDNMKASTPPKNWGF